MIIIKNNNDCNYKYAINSKLRENNKNKCAWIKRNMLDDANISTKKEHNFLAFDDDKLVGGAIGFVDYNWYYLELLYVNADYRDLDIGSNLIKNIEAFAKLDNCPPGTIEYQLKKIL